MLPNTLIIRETMQNGQRRSSNGNSNFLNVEEQVPLKGERPRKTQKPARTSNLPTRTDETTPLTSSARNKRKQFARKKTARERCRAFASIGASIVALVLVAIFVFSASFGGRFPGPMGGSGSSHAGAEETTQVYDLFGRLVIEDYDSKPPFSDFLPALAGYYGKPLYAFYVNRGQGIASFGIESKDYPIMEFNSANNAYQITPFVGFRTFLQGTRKNRPFLVEPFSPLRTKFDANTKLPQRTMFLGANEMQLQEVDSENEIETNGEKRTIAAVECFLSSIVSQSTVFFFCSDLHHSPRRGLWCLCSPCDHYQHGETQCLFVTSGRTF